MPRIARRLALALILIAFILSFYSTVRVEASPPALSCSSANAAITSPAPGSVLAGIVQIEGVAQLAGQFQYYKLEFAQAGRNDFTVFSGLIRQQVARGQLAVWDSASVPDGVYNIRLRVVDATGNYCDNTETLISGLKVQNSSPPTAAPSPTAVETEVTPAFSVVPTAIPTIIIPGNTELLGGQAQATPQPPAGGTRTPSAVAGPLTGFSVDSVTAPLGQIFGGFARAFAFGVMAMAGIMLLVGVIFFVRRVL